MNNRWSAVLIVLVGVLLIAMSSPCSALDWRWEKQRSGVTNSIRGLCAVDRDVCWFGTGGGIIGRTTDGGRTWEQIVVEGAKELQFRDVEAFDADRCLAMTVGAGGESRIYRTLDGGASWTMVHKNPWPKGFYNGMEFWDEKRGILAGDPVNGRLHILLTVDGGKTWRGLPDALSPEMAEGEYAFAASGTHVNVGPGGRAWVGSGGAVARVFNSHDYGRTWSVVNTPMIAGEKSTGVFSISARGAVDVWAVGGDYAKESVGVRNAMRSKDGGESWKLLEGAASGTLFPFRSCVQIVPGKQWIIVTGPQGSDWSNDNGVTWTRFGGEGYHVLSVGRSLNAIWAAGSGGRVSRLR